MPKFYYMMKSLALLIAILCATSAAFANSYLYKPLAIPKSEEIAAFSNGLPPATNERRILTRDQLLKFLSKGRSNTNISTWPSRITKFNRDSPCDGVFTDRSGNVYFWVLVSPNGLRLYSAEGEYAYLEIPPKKEDTD
jgi:hypothetical protein